MEEIEQTVYEATETAEAVDVTEYEDEMAAFVQSAFQRAKDKKLQDETRALMAYRNFRGIYGPETVFSEHEKSRVFLKITKTKVQAAYGQVLEVLFGNAGFPIAVNETKLPEGVLESVSMSTNPQVQSSPEAKNINQKPLIGASTELKPGQTLIDLQKTGPLKEKLAPVQDKLVAGPGTTPTDVTFSPAHVAAKKMEKTIHDQLDESGASKHLRSSVFEGALFGTAILKGPLLQNKEYPNWSEDGTYTPVIKSVPFVEHVSFWNFYPDPDALNMDQAEYTVERHKFSRKQLRDLKSRPFFDEDAIDALIADGPNYTREYWESAMEDGNTSLDINRWEILEYWGYADAETLKERGMVIPHSLRKEKTLNVNIWVSHGRVIRCVLNPFKPARIPYYAVPFEHNPYSFFGIGVAENMEDTQILLNGFMRMAVDNAALSGNLVFEVDESNLVPGQDLEVYPGKIFRRQSGPPGQAVFGTQFPNTSQQNLMMFDKARLLADESTGLPSYSHGQTGIQGVGRTASGISMFFNAANSYIRTVVKNFDDYLLEPLGKALFAFNMQFNRDPEIKGDLEVSAKGTESLMANEVRSQRLMQFLQTVSNPILAPYAKLDMIVRDIARALDLDEDRVTNSLADAAIQAQLISKMQATMNPTAGGPAPPGSNPMDTSGGGGGNIGMGSVPTPGTPGFSANNGSMTDAPA